MIPGYKTTSFYLSLASLLFGHLLVGQFMGGSVLVKILGVITQILSAVGYTWSRSATKIGAIDGSDLKSGWHSTEFWLSAFSSVLGGITASGAIGSETIIQALGLVQTNIVGALYLFFHNRVGSAQIVDAKQRTAMEVGSIRTVVSGPSASQASTDDGVS